MDFTTVTSQQDDYVRAHSCSHCQKIVLRTGCSEEVQVIWRVGSLKDVSLHDHRVANIALTRMDVSYQNLTDASRAGCDFARCLLRDLGKQLRDGTNANDIQLYAKLGCGKIDFCCLMEVKCAPQSSNQGADSDVGQRFVCATQAFEAHDAATCYLVEDQESPIGHLPGVEQQIAADPLSPSTVSSILEWIADCSGNSTSTHKICSLDKPAYLPTRLIEINPRGPDFQLKLVYKDPLEGIAYAALSYCWGTDLDRSMLKMENLTQYETEIPWGVLPKTLQDAVITTYKLGIQHLWVDSLCIIQNSETDKITQISQMTWVYSHASLTIMAKRANKATAGFLHTRSLPSGSSTLRFQDQDRQVGSVTLYFKSSVKDDDYTRLDTRGWVLQETVLSSRSLTFGTWRTEWTCRRQRPESEYEYNDGWKVAKDHGYEVHPFDNCLSWENSIPGFKGTYVLDAIMFLSSNPNVRVSRTTPREMTISWNSLVEQYTRRCLSVERDRCLAISGLAERFSVLIPGFHQYTAGLWAHSLPWSLLWWCIESHPSPRPSQYQGPTWSWLSINDGVRFSSRSWGSLASVISAESKLVSEEAPFGALRSAHLQISGPAIGIEWQHENNKCGSRDQHGPVSQWIYRKSGNNDICGTPDIDVRLDAREPDTNYTPVTLIAIDFQSKDFTGRKSRLEGIVLRRFNDNQHRRLGYFRICDYNDTYATSCLPHLSNWHIQEFVVF